MRELSQPALAGVTLPNEPLANHTTFRIGGPADRLVIPRSEEELIRVIQACRSEGLPYRLLGNGSNLLVSDTGVRGVVIKNTQACTALSVAGELVEAGASVKLQAFIKFCVAHDREGLEYLYSVPATIGGAVCMNAGRGKRHQLQIGDQLAHVRVFDGEAVRVLDRDACAFAYRTSVFQRRRDWVILGAAFRLAAQPRAVGEQRIRERMDYIRTSQDLTHPCAGSIFRDGAPLMLELLKGRRVGGAEFSRKSRNWIKNVRHATASDVLQLIRQAQRLHALLGRTTALELEVWER